MKRMRILMAVAIVTSLTMLAGNALAQRGQGRGMNNNQDRGSRMTENCILDLTPEQQGQINSLRANHLKEVTPLRNQLGEKRARLQTQKSEDTYDLNAINKTIDEMSAIRANMQKKGAAHRAEVSKLLTDDQRAIFNAKKSGKRGGKGSSGMGKGERCFAN